MLYIIYYVVGNNNVGTYTATQIHQTPPSKDTRHGHRLVFSLELRGEGWKYLVGKLSKIFLKCLKKVSTKLSYSLFYNREFFKEGEGVKFRDYVVFEWSEN